MLAGLAAALTAVLNAGNPVVSYLSAIAGSSGADLVGVTDGHDTKALFADSAGTGPAPWEQVLLIAATVLCTAALLVVLGHVRRAWRAAKPLALLVGLIALLYPLIPGGHIASATAEVGDRAAGFVFVGTAAVLAAWWVRRRRRALAVVAFTVACTVAFLGNVILGAGPTRSQLPGPYEIASDQHSVDAYDVAAARWMKTGIPTDSVVYGDRVAGALAAAYGGQDNVLHVATGIDASRLLLAPTVTAADLAVIRRSGIEYLIVDRRLANGLPHEQVYIEAGEYGSEDRTEPVPLSALTKFASVPGVQTLYDNGAIAVYDLRSLG